MRPGSRAGRGAAEPGRLCSRPRHPTASAVPSPARSEGLHVAGPAVGGRRSAHGGLRDPRRRGSPSRRRGGKRPARGSRRDRHRRDAGGAAEGARRACREPAARAPRAHGDVLSSCDIATSAHLARAGADDARARLRPRLPRVAGPPSRRAGPALAGRPRCTGGGGARGSSAPRPSATRSASPSAPRDARRRARANGRHAAGYWRPAGAPAWPTSATAPYSRRRSCPAVGGARRSRRLRVGDLSRREIARRADDSDGPAPPRPASSGAWAAPRRATATTASAYS